MQAYLVLAIWLLALGFGGSSLRAHEWYPFECCSGDDCAPVTSETPGIAGSRVMTSKHGTVVVPQGFATRQSKDLQTHVCVMRTPRGLIPICVFRPDMM